MRQTSKYSWNNYYLYRIIESPKEQATVGFDKEKCLTIKVVIDS